jgi:hypothetical protein
MTVAVHKPELAELFHENRKCAFHSGDKDAVGVLFRLLHVASKDKGVDVLSLEAQLCREYEISRDDLRAAFERAADPLMQFMRRVAGHPDV